tara:strand:+ start:450 stop:671 length:222 start_codon:yes stop_codon:yes gene_type:complete
MVLAINQPKRCKMKKLTYKQAIKWAGNANQLAKKLGITRQAIHDWKGVIPEMRQFQISVLQWEEVSMVNPGNK